MIKVFEDFYDKFTSKELHFTVEKEYGEEIIEILSMSTNNGSIFSQGYKPRDFTLQVLYENEKTIYNITINMTDKEWYNLLKLCKEKKYQLIVKDKYDEIYFSKIKES